jgi:MPBQ/MSBQ methyltransferase
LYFRFGGRARPKRAFWSRQEELQRLLQVSGFTIASWEDTTAAGTTWFTNLLKKVQETGIPLLGFHLLMGGDFEVLAQNQCRNLQKNRIALVQVIATK